MLGPRAVYGQESNITALGLKDKRDRDEGLETQQITREDSSVTRNHEYSASLAHTSCRNSAVYKHNVTDTPLSTSEPSSSPHGHNQTQSKKQSAPLSRPHPVPPHLDGK